MSLKNNLIFFKNPLNIACVTMSIFFMILAGHGCTHISTPQDLTWNEYPSSERIKQKCCLILPDGLKSYVTYSSGLFGNYQINFGESLINCWHEALSKVFDEVVVLSNQSQINALPEDTVVVEIKNIRGTIFPPPPPPPDFGPKPSAQLTIEVEIRTSNLKKPLFRQIFVRMESMAGGYGWLDEVANGTVEKAGNELTIFITTNRQYLSVKQ